MTFTPDEINLMCIYDTSNREHLIKEMGALLNWWRTRSLRI